MNPKWNYSKAEDLYPYQYKPLFSHLITSSPLIYRRDYHLMARIYAFNGIELDKKPMWVRIHWDPVMYIMERRENTSSPIVPS